MTKPGDLGRLMRGAELFRVFARLGRPLGVRNLSEAEFADRLPAAYAEFEHRHGRKPVQVEIAYELGVSPPTFKRYLRTYKAGGGTWPPAKHY